MDPEDIWAPGILDEEREHRDRIGYDDRPSPSEFYDDEGEPYDAEDMPW